MALMRNWLPPLQVLEQADQASHSPHVQLTKDAPNNFSTKTIILTYQEVK